MSSREISLTSHFEDFIARQVDSGKYQDASEVMQAALRLLEQREQEDAARLEHLPRLATESFAALDRGEGVALNGPAELADYIAELGRRRRREMDDPTVGLTHEEVWQQIRRRHE